MKHLVDRLIELLFGTLPGCPLSGDDNEEHDADDEEDTAAGPGHHEGEHKSPRWYDLPWVVWIDQKLDLLSLIHV